MAEALNLSGENIGRISLILAERNLQGYDNSKDEREAGFYLLAAEASLKVARANGFDTRGYETILLGFKKDYARRKLFRSLDRAF